MRLTMRKISTPIEVGKPHNSFLPRNGRDAPATQQFNNEVRLCVVAPNGAPGHSDAVVNGELLVRSSRTPFCDADRGVDSNSCLLLRHAVAREGWASWGNQAPVADNDDGLDIPEFSRGEAAANGGAA